MLARKIGLPENRIQVWYTYAMYIYYCRRLWKKFLYAIFEIFANKTFIKVWFKNRRAKERQIKSNEDLRNQVYSGALSSSSTLASSTNATINSEGIKHINTGENSAVEISVSRSNKNESASASNNNYGTCEKKMPIQKVKVKDEETVIFTFL